MKFTDWYIKAYPAQYFSRWTSRMRTAEEVCIFGKTLLRVCYLAYRAGRIGRS